MLEAQRATLLDYVQSGVYNITTRFYEKEYNSRLDIIPMTAADAVFSITQIGYEVFSDKCISSKNEEIHLASRIVIPLIFQWAIYITASKVRGVALEVWLPAMGWGSVEYVIDSVIAQVRRKLDNEIKVLNAERGEPELGAEMVKELDSKIAMLDAKKELFKSLWVLIKFFTITSYLNKTQELRSPHLPSSVICIPLISGILASVGIKNKKVTDDDSKFLTAFSLGLAGSWATHYVLQKLEWVDRPFLWKAELAQLGATVFAGWILYSENSPCYSPHLER